MSGNSFGILYKVTTFGESHGGSCGCIIDGCPPGLKLSEENIQPDLDKRRPGQSSITSARAEKDKIHILSGVFNGKTTGTPILLEAYNKDKKSKDYWDIQNLYRPSHADYTYEAKYGIRDWAGGGRSSGRETLARVAAGAVAKKFLKETLSVDFLSYVEQIGSIKSGIDYRQVEERQIESNIVRCPDQKIALQMIELIEEIKAEGDSIGGIIGGVIKNLPVGLGEPVFDKLSADLAKAMLSIGAAKGFEYGSGFGAATMRGSEHNDEFYVDKNKTVRTKTNNSGGIQGGISNGEDVYFKVAFKPTATIAKPQKTVTIDDEEITLQVSGRHDPCILPRVAPVVSAMAAIVVMDHYLRHKAQNL